MTAASLDHSANRLRPVFHSAHVFTKQRKSATATRRHVTGRSAPFTLRRYLAVTYNAATPQSSALATYHPSLIQTRQSLFEKCLVELVSNLHQAPLFQSVDVFNGFTFEHRSITNDGSRDIDVESADVVILCQSVPERLKKSSPESAIVAGKVGDCCNDTSADEASDALDLSVDHFWGLVVKSVTFPAMEGCYLMRTSQAGGHNGFINTRLRGVFISSQCS